MATICVDFSKAFDSIEHEFIEKVLRYFNFGRNMTNMVMTILRDREGMVILDGGYSKRFKIERGTPQGDRSSPYIFILCIEILIMKLEKKGEERGMVLEFNREYKDRYMLDTLVAEAYADDLTVMIKWDLNSAKEVIAIIKDFELVSGLEINVNKTQLMLTGIEIDEDRQRQIEEELEGIKIVKRIELLGIEIPWKLDDNLDRNWEKIENKIVNIANYWRQFNMSIGARIMVAKTYLLSQVTYCLGVLPIKENTANRLNELMIGFIKGRDRGIARERWFLEPGEGGYGMIDIKTMDLCVKAAWVVKWLKQRSNKDYVNMKVLNGMEGLGSIEGIGNQQPVGRGNFITRIILDKWITYKRKFYEVGRNMLMAKVFGNVGLGNLNTKVENLVFERNRRVHIERNIEEIRLKDLLTTEGEIEQKNTVERVMGIRLNFAEFFRLRNIIYELKNMARGEGIARKLEFIGIGKVRGGGHLRKILKDRNGIEKLRELPYLRTQIGNMEVDVRVTSVWQGSWNYGKLNPKLRNFLFKQGHGQVLFNREINRFDRTVDENCTLCRIIEGGPILQEETIKHVYWECRGSTEVLQEVKRKLGEPDMTWEEFIIGKWMGGRDRTLVRTWILTVYRYYIYRCKISKVLPNIRGLRYEINNLQYVLNRGKYRGVIEKIYRLN
jgi:hypothetical protein